MDSSDAIREYVYEYLGHSREIQSFADEFVKMKELENEQVVLSGGKTTRKSVTAVLSDSAPLSTQAVESREKKNKKKKKKRGTAPDHLDDH